MDSKLRFNPDKVAYYEKAGWEAYYDRDWLRAFRLMVQLNREEFRMPFPAAVAGALDVVRASIAFAPVDNDIPRTKESLRRYFDRARRSSGIPIDAATLSELEIDYWIVHRRLAVERMKQPDLDNTGPMVESLVRLHSALFGGAPEAVRRSAEYRALAAKAVDRITGRYSTDIAEDWRQVEAYLQQAYREIAAALPPS